MIAADYLKELIDVNIDTLVLGCTHYPLLKGVIGETMGDKVQLIDSADATAQELAALLSIKDLARSSKEKPTHKFYVSDVPDKFSKVAELFLGRSIDNITRVDITRY